MNSEYLYIGCNNAKLALGEGGHSRRRAEAFAFAIYIKARLGHSAAKKEQIEHFYAELGIGDRRKKRLVPDIIKMGLGRMSKSGTLTIGCVKNIKANNVRVERQRIASCVQISSLVFIIREIALLNHLHRQGQINYFKNNLQNAKTTACCKKAMRKLCRSVDTDTFYDFLSFGAISRLLHSGKAKTYSLIDSLEKRNIVLVKRSKWEKLADNVSELDTDMRNIIFSDLKDKNRKGVFIYKNTLYSIDCTQYFLNRDMNIYTFTPTMRKKHSPFLFYSGCK